MSFRATKLTPVLFSTDFNTIAAAQTVIPDMGLMSSRMRRPMLVDEIRWTYLTGAGANMGFNIRCKLQVGRIALTGTRDGGNFVPIWNFGPAQHSVPYSEFIADTAVIAGQVNVGHYRWKLPKPLYLPAGQSLTPSLYRINDSLGTVTKIGIAVVGREIGDAGRKLPDKIQVPYVAYYEPSANARSAISSELELVNPFLVPLHVQRFIGRQPGLTSTQIYEGQNLTFNGAADAANVAVKDTYGMNVVRDIVPMGNVYDAPRRSWTYQRVLAPKERFVVQLSSIVQGGVTTTYCLPQISMIGWRDEVLK